MAEQVETTARTVEEAVKLALLKLNATLDEVDIKILDSGTPGRILGLGSREAQILVTRRTSPYTGEDAEPATALEPQVKDAHDDESVDDVRETPPQIEEVKVAVDSGELIETASELLQGLVDRMGYDATVETKGEDPPSFNIRADDDEELDSLIGPRGDTLRAFGFLVNSMLGRIAQRGVRIFVDVNSYRESRETELGDLARSAADSVRNSDEPVTLESMPAHERRLVHIALSDDDDVRTYSIGEGKERRVVIGPKG